MANEKDIELRIRARDFSQKTLKQVTSAINEMAKAQDQQRLAAERGEITVKELEASYRKLEDAGKALIKLNSLVEVYKRQSAALADQTAKTELAKQKQQQLVAEYRNLESVTKRQETALASANRAVETSSRKQQEASDRVANTANQLKRYGVETDNIARSQGNITSAIARVNTVLERQEGIINKAPELAARYKSAKDQQTRADQDAALAASKAMDLAHDSALAQNKIIDSLRRQADQALAAARGYKTLGRVVSSLGVKDSGLAGQLNAIVSPAQAARSTLSGLESQVKTLDRELRQAGKGISDAAGKLRELKQAQDAAIAIAGLIDKFKQQVVAVRQAREEFKSARSEVQNLANQMRSAQNDTQGLGLRMQEAQQRLNAATNALRNQGTEARNTQQALRRAGIDTKSLATEELRLKSTTESATGSVNKLTKAIRENANATRDGGKAFSFFAGEGRKTLSAMQRVRGEVLSLVTAYVGIQGGINLASGAIDAYKMRQQALIKMGVVVGSSLEAQNAEWEYMLGISHALGIEINVLSKAYSKFAVAANAVGTPLTDAKYIFESVAKAGRVFQLTADEMNGTFLALEQMMSKGQVYSQELRQQLGERLPGAVAIFAKGMNMSTVEMMKLMEQGGITAAEIMNFATELSRMTESQLAAATKSVTAIEARAANAFTLFKLALADSGFIEAYSQMLEKLTEFLNSDKGQQAAQKLGEAFSKLADGIIWCVDNVDTLIKIFTALLALKLVGFVVSLAGTTITLVKSLAKLGVIGDKVLGFLTRYAARLTAGTGAAKLFGLALKGLVRAIPFVGWALLTYDIGAIFYQQSLEFRKAVDYVIRDFKNLGNQLFAVLESVPAILKDVLSLPLDIFSWAVTVCGNYIADILELIPYVGDNIAKFVRGYTAQVTAENRVMFENVSKVWDDVNKKWRDMNEQLVTEHAAAAAKIKNQNADLAFVGPPAPSGSNFRFTEDPGTGPTAMQREVNALTKEFAKLENQAKAAELAGRKALEQKNLSGRLAIIDSEYADYMTRAMKVEGDEGAKLVAQLQKIIEVRKKAETDKYNATVQEASLQRRAELVQKLTQRYDQLRASVEAKQTKIDPSTTLDQRTKAEINKLQEEYNKLRADAAKIGGREGSQLTENLDKLEQENILYVKDKMQLEEIVRLQGKVNSLLETRKSLLEEVESNKQAGAITEQMAVEQTQQIQQQTEPGINQALDSLDAQATTSQSLLGPEAFARLQADIAAAKAGLKDLTGTFTKMEQTMVNGVLQGMEVGVNSIVDSMTQLVSGTASLSDVFANVGQAMLQFFADFLKQIAMAILQQLLLNAIAGMGGGMGNAAKTMGGVAKAHNGGIVGGFTDGGKQRSGGVPTNWFANAPRFHGGGFPGLRSDEVPTILQKGEEVLAKDDPNNLLNRNRSSSSSYDQQQQSMRFVLVDDRSKVPEAMNTPDGEMAILQILQRNAPTVRQIVQTKGRR